MQAARAILAQPASFPEVVARLFDAEADPADARLAPVQDVMDMTVGDVQVQVRRTAPFTATEHARGAAMADLVSDVLERGRDAAMSPPAGRRVGRRAPPPTTWSRARPVTALVDDHPVGVAAVRPETG